MREDTYRKVKSYIVENKMIEPKDKYTVIAGVSGGGDSMALLDILDRLREEMGFSLEAVHVNHGIRGPEAERDQDLVERICKERRILCRVFRYDVPGLAEKWKTGLEEAGRRVRREAFAQAERTGPGTVKRIALAHNRNDLAETMLHHLARGSGLRGLSGIRAVSGSVIRPVLCLERGEIDHYLEERKIPYVLDSSNLEDAYTRNRIRHHILPLLEQEVNERAAEHMAEAAGIFARADAYLAKAGKKLLEGSRQEDSSYLLPNTFWEEETILQEYAVMEALEQLAGRRKDLTSLHVGQVLAMAKRQTGRRAELPYGLLAEKTYEGVRIRKGSGKKRSGGEIAERKCCFSETEEPDSSAYWELPLEGKLVCSLGSFETEVFFYQDQKISEKKYTKWLDYDKIKDSLSNLLLQEAPEGGRREGFLCVRTRREKDFIVVNRQGNRKKLTRCMIDEKIPRECRSRIPLVACADEILWIVGGRISEKYKITRETKRVLVLKYQGGSQDERED